jgi:uncharacterized protein
MTAQEQQMLQGLTDRVNQTKLPEKDEEAEQMLEQTLGRNPDALYILAQTVLVQQYALEQAQKQLADAREQADQLRQQMLPPPGQQSRHSTSFLGNLLGLKDDEPVRSNTPQQPPPYAPVQGYAPVPGYGGGPVYGQPGYGPPVGYGGGGFGAPQSGGFLRSAAQTAAGVAAGALAFEGIESLMHGFGHAAGYGSEFGTGFGGVGGFGGAGRPEEIVNNYYGDTVPGAEHAGHAEHSDYLSQGGDSRGSNVDYQGTDDRSGDSSRLSDAVYSEDRGAGSDAAPGDDLSAADDSSSYDDSGDSGGGFDSGSDFDSGGGDSGGGDVSF